MLLHYGKMREKVITIDSYLGVVRFRSRKDFIPNITFFNSNY